VQRVLFILSKFDTRIFDSGRPQKKQMQITVTKCMDCIDFIKQN